MASNDVHPLPSGVTGGEGSAGGSPTHCHPRVSINRTINAGSPMANESSSNAK